MSGNVRIAFLFPGQGAQRVGMGKQFYDTEPTARALMDQAGALLGLSFLTTLFAGPETALRETSVTQPALFTVSAACCLVLRKHGVAPDMVAGHSVGEYAALWAAGAFDFPTGFQLVQKRGEVMQQAAAHHPGSMLAVIGLSTQQVNTLCAEASRLGVCQPANWNCPEQVVIAGEPPALAEAQRLAQGAGARVVPLEVSGAFHTPLMAEASTVMREVLKRTAFAEPTIPVVSNWDGQPSRSAKALQKKLIHQLDHPVLWESSMRTLRAQGIETFIEVGPGRVLSGLLRKIDRHARCFQVEDPTSLAATLEGIKEHICD
ncbi:MAG: ACP S-malonyltransferase [Elusimicrobia bacterium]|nr:ACP S-malonyltransferase [Elusimicrobiota bacterium]